MNISYYNSHIKFNEQEWIAKRYFKGNIIFNRQHFFFLYYCPCKICREILYTKLIGKDNRGILTNEEKSFIKHSQKIFNSRFE